MKTTILIEAKPLSRLRHAARSLLAQTLLRLSRPSSALLLAVAFGCAPMVHPPDPAPSLEARIVRIAPCPAVDEARERLIVGAKNAPGVLVEAGHGDPAIATVVLVHGINSAPDQLAPLTAAAAARGGSVLLFAYDDRFRTLEADADDLAEGLATVIRLSEGAPISIKAHSMGARIVLLALDELQSRGRLVGAGPIDIELIAPPLGGVAAADLARFSPGFIGGWIGGVRPGRGMGPGSPVQKRIEAVHLPPCIKVTVFIAGQDRLVDPGATRFRKVVVGLHAEVVTVARANHTSILKEITP